MVPMAEKLHSAAKRPVLALDPFSVAANRFPGLFSNHIDSTCFDKVAFERHSLGRGRYDIVIFHWPLEFFRASRKTALKTLACMFIDKIRNKTKFVWVVHNLPPHEGPGKNPGLITRPFLRLLDGVIFLSENSRQEFHLLHPSTTTLPDLVTVHGRYEPFLEPARDSIPSERRNKLLFFGLIRDYKNIERLVAEARKAATDPFSLTVVGACWEDELERSIRAAAGDDRRIRLDIRNALVPDDELERVIDAHDAVVLPYRNILNSGAALHALARNKPILAPRMGGLPELQHAVGGEWVHLFDDEISVRSIEAFLEGLESLADGRPDLSLFDWDRIGSDLTQFLRSL
jgi:beta-1,4-mannosyltransferase